MKIKPDLNSTSKFNFKLKIINYVNRSIKEILSSDEILYHIEKINQSLFVQSNHTQGLPPNVVQKIETTLLKIFIDH